MNRERMAHRRTRRVKIGCCLAQFRPPPQASLTSFKGHLDAALIAYRELDDALGLMAISGIVWPMDARAETVGII
jgi:hypothetical protein